MTGARIERRTLLGAALLTGVAGLTGCADRPDVPRRDLVPADGGGGVNPTPTVTPSPTPMPTPTGTPTPADWKAFGESLSGKLFRPGDVGYPVAHQLFDPVYDSVMPTAVVECANTSDVVKSLAFRARFGLPVVGKSGGHSYVGASTTQGGMVISVRSISDISVSGDSARVGAGAPLSAVYSQLAAKGRVIPAGSCPSVGVAGLALGGGLGLANRIYGLTCDVITEVEVVTPDGVVRTASSSKEPKLFFACRGGGGGTLGVVTAFTFRTFASPLIGTFRAQWSWSNAAAVTRGWQRYLQGASDQVWPSLRLIANPGGSQSAVVFGIDAANDPNAALDALVRAVGADPVQQTSNKNQRFHADPPDQRTVFFAGTDILGTPLTASGISNVIAAMNDKAHATKLAATAIFDPLGGAIGKLAVNATAFPWRKSFTSIQWYSERGGATPAAARAWIAAGHKAVAASAVGGYVNYLESDRTNGQLYFGPNTAQLREAKAMYDPNDVFKLPYTL